VPWPASCDWQTRLNACWPCLQPILLSTAATGPSVTAYLLSIARCADLWFTGFHPSCCLKTACTGLLRVNSIDDDRGSRLNWLPWHEFFRSWSETIWERHGSARYTSVNACWACLGLRRGVLIKGNNCHRDHWCCSHQYSSCLSFWLDFLKTMGSCCLLTEY